MNNRAKALLGAASLIREFVKQASKEEMAKNSIAKIKAAGMIESNREEEEALSYLADLSEEQMEAALGFYEKTASSSNKGFSFGDAEEDDPGFSKSAGIPEDYQSRFHSFDEALMRL